MRAFSHVLLSAPFIYGASATGFANDTLLDYGLGALGALLPDIDHPESWLGRRLKPISIPISAVFGHRGITHSLLAILALGIVLLGEIGPAWVSPLVVGYLSHLAGDWLTKSGIPLFYPLRTPFRAPITFRTGGAGEALVLAAMLFLGIHLILG